MIESSRQLHDLQSKMKAAALWDRDPDLQKLAGSRRNDEQGYSIFPSQATIIRSVGDDTIRLLDLWLSLCDTPSGRDHEFADLSRAAEIAGVSRRTLQNWVDSGQVLSLRIGNKHQVYLQSLRRYLLLRACASASGD